MTEQEFKDWLMKSGWKIADDRFSPYSQWYAYKQMTGWTFCRCNDKPPSVYIYFYELQMGQNEYRSIEVKIVAETKMGVWVDFKFYSVTLDGIKKKLPKLICKLRSAWEAVN